MLQALLEVAFQARGLAIERDLTDEGTLCLWNTTLVGTTRTDVPSSLVSPSWMLNINLVAWE